MNETFSAATAAAHTNHRGQHINAVFIPDLRCKLSFNPGNLYSPNLESVGFSHGSIREAQGTEGRGKAAKDFSSTEQDRQTHATRSTSRKASGRGGTACN